MFEFTKHGFKLHENTAKNLRLRRAIGYPWLRRSLGRKQKTPAVIGLADHLIGDKIQLHRDLIRDAFETVTDRAVATIEERRRSQCPYKHA